MAKTLNYICVILVLCIACSYGEQGALYYSTNDPINGNRVGIFSIGNDNKLVWKGTVDAGGIGAIAQFSGIADPFFAVNTVVEGDGHLFVVNMGSNTISTFKINEKDPTKIRLLNTIPTSSTGTLPAAVAYSSKFKVACVLNALGANGVNCFRLKKTGLKPIHDAVAVFNLPASVAASFSDIKFNEESSLLFVTYNAASPGYVITIKVTGSGYKGFSLGEPVYTQPTGGKSFYSLVNVAGKENTIMYTDPLHGHGIASFDNDGELVNGSFYHVPDEKNDFCWSEYSPKTGNYYLVDFESKLLVEFSLDASGTSYISSRTKLNSYPQDLRIVTLGEVDYVFVLEPANRIIDVIRLTASRDVNVEYSFDFTSLPIPFSNYAGVLPSQTEPDVFNKFSQGLAIYLKSK